MIDCIAWATLDAAKVIESANYSGESINDQENGENEENGNIEEVK